MRLVRPAVHSRTLETIHGEKVRQWRQFLPCLLFNLPKTGLYIGRSWLHGGQIAVYGRPPKAEDACSGAVRISTDWLGFTDDRKGLIRRGSRGRRAAETKVRPWAERSTAEDPSLSSATSATLHQLNRLT